jgi:hypothetical protein
MSHDVRPSRAPHDVYISCFIIARRRRNAMTAHCDCRPAAYLIAALGCLVAVAAALVPFYSVGYQVDALALAALATPFVVYGMFSEDLRGPWLMGAGLVLLGVTLAVVIGERVGYQGYAAVYWVPLAAVAVLLPVALAFGRRPPYS